MLFEDGSVTISLVDRRSEIVVILRHEKFEIQYTFDKESWPGTNDEQRRQAIKDAAIHMTEGGQFISHNLDNISLRDLSADTIIL